MTSLCILYANPVAEHLPHGSLIIWPVPWHLLHVVVHDMNPRCKNITPLPPQFKHFTGDVPGRHFLPWHVSQSPFYSYCTYFLIPSAASIKVTSRRMLMSSPL